MRSYNKSSHVICHNRNWISAHDSFCECVLDEMERKLDKKMVHINTGLSNK